MAAANPLTVPSTVPYGTHGTIAVTFKLAPAAPDVTATISLSSNGVVQQQGTAVLKGAPAETLPPVTLSKTGIGWELSTSAGTLGIGTGVNGFTIAY